MTGRGTGDAAAVTASRLLGRPVRTVGRLAGGEHAVTTAVTDGVTEYVLRTFPPGDAAVRNEIAALDRLDELGDLVPKLVAFEDSSESPSILTLKVAGSHPAPDLSTYRIAVHMGAVLARIHAIDPAGLRCEPPTAPAAGTSRINRRARQEQGGPRDDKPVLIHGDFWCGNALWSGDTIAGVVDWSGARSGARGIDLAWCRQDLVLLGDPNAADVMLATYREASGHPVQDIAARDRHAAAQAEPVVETWAANYAGIGRPELTGPVLRRRLTAWISTLLES